MLGQFDLAGADVVSRIRFRPRQATAELLYSLNLANVMFDLLHFGGVNTAYEVLRLGFPIVTIPGRFMRDRVRGPR